MNPKRMLALQSTRVPSNDGIRGGTPYMTPELAAFYCQGMPKLHYYSARLMWALDDSVEKFLTEALTEYAAKISKRYGIPKKRTEDGTINEMIKMVILETKNPSKLRHDQVKAARLGVHRHTYRKTLKAPYEELFSIFNELSNCGARYIHKQQAKEELNLT